MDLDQVMISCTKYQKSHFGAASPSGWHCKTIILVILLLHFLAYGIYSITDFLGAITLENKVDVSLNNLVIMEDSNMTIFSRQIISINVFYQVSYNDNWTISASGLGLVERK